MGSPKLGHAHDLAEDETLERIRRTLGGGIQAAGLRDDAAVLHVPGGGPLVVSVDSVVEGVHVDLALSSAPDVGWKALMSALSDLAAMGARPLGALVALCVPEADGHGVLALRVTEGVAEAARAASCPVVGGDVSSAPVLTVSVTVLGTVEDGTPVSRKGAEVGDVVMVTGPCGGSAAGLRMLAAAREAGHPGSLDGPGSLDESAAVNARTYRRPVARLALGVTARQSGAHAMIDISDGLALDLHRLADASAVGFALEHVPVAPGADLDEALGGGEDYELLLTIGESAADDFARRCATNGLPAPIRIGTVVADVATRTLEGRPLGRMGWQHRVG